ncbi:protein NBR1 homolog isoform X2 [Selaginella moellendorffii]|uniref:protein NBR1 homolog isoform X2 n=1 Tax=Selaginella moellendorffii TaxID=88036 RepID=UPI000D1C7D02|nr:protein NBR1 homolog isoform X2 [Selaginella moellendorffii]|eukprot:XP_024533376.1 protein NBR1 homolog isoform X2 [Selaginella moellendorffii]
MAFVIKIRYEESLRRLTVPASSNGAPAISFAELHSKICDSFGIPTASKLVITYVDKDNDVITMANDQELEDACVLQGINPLRLDVRLEVPLGSSSSSSEGAFVGDIKPILEAALKAFDAETLKEAVHPFLKPHMVTVADLMRGLSGKIRAESSTTTSAAEKSAAAPDAVPPPAGDRSEAPRSGMENVFHQNVQCDGCGTSPIVGPRFKSTSKHDYDLCVTCFNNLPKGGQLDYTRYDKPIHRHHYVPPGRVGRCPAAFGPNRCRSAWGRAGDYHRHSETEFAPRPFSPFSPFGRPMDVAYAKPDGRFVCDVSIPDGTEVSPHTRFVKIWRLRNSGKVAWAPDTRLVRVGGDEMGTVSAVSLQTEGASVLPDAEVEVAVDLVAPARAGRYASYWRLVTPYGVKFGHRVWALIQVTPNASESDVEVKAEKPAGEESPVVVVDFDDEATSVEVEVMVGEAVPSEKSFEGEDFKADEVDDGFSLVEMPKSEEASASSPPMPPMPEPEPELEAAEVPATPLASAEKRVTPVAPVTPVTPEASLESQKEKAAVFFQTMGFTNKKELIYELLEKNNNDFHRTLDDLVAAAEWDPILEELQEMGFYDTEMNRKLMIKNGGSVKRVVKELVQMYKEPAPKLADKKD